MILTSAILFHRMVEWRVFAVSGSLAASVANGGGRVGGHRDVSLPFTRPRKKRGSGLEASFENRGASRRRCWIARFGDFARTVHPAGDARGGRLDGRGDRHGHGGRRIGGLGASATHGEKFEFGTRRAGSSEWKSSDSASEPRHPA